jgi:hypothetical protein
MGSQAGGAGIIAGHLPLSWVLAVANEQQLRQHSDRYQGHDRRSLESGERSSSPAGLIAELFCRCGQAIKDRFAHPRDRNQMQGL